MDKEVNPAVLAVINEKRLQADKRSPAEIVTRMGVPDARQRAFDSAWLATGDVVIATLWGEFVAVGAGGPWFYLEPLDTEHRVGGGTRGAAQAQRAKDRLALLKRSLDAGRGFRAVLQTNRVEIGDMETNKAAKVSTRVPDDQEWHVARWDPQQMVAVLVRGPRGWLPSEEDMQAARARCGVPAAGGAPQTPTGEASPDDVRAAAMAYLMRHFGGYGYKTEDVTGRHLGYDIVVSDKKGKTLLKLAVKGTAAGLAGFELTAEERACAKLEDPWRLAVVRDALYPAAQHKLYKASEIAQAPELKPAA